MTENQARTKRKNAITAGERRLSIVILGILSLIAAVMLVVQGRFDPGTWRERAATTQPDTAARQSGTPSAGNAHDTAAGLEPVSEAEHYNADTLSDKIDGKADLYLSAGFKGLSTRRYALAGDKSRWMERYVYDMGDLRNAFAVFSAQRRPNAQPLGLGAYAYLAGNGLFFVHGPFYVEIIAVDASQGVQKGMNALAKAFVASHAVRTEDLPELRLFPSDHLVAGSFKLAALSAFGIQGLDGVFTAAYAGDQAQALAFVSRRASREEAEALAVKFHAFWLDFGGEKVAPSADLQGAGIVLILDNYEICLVQDDYVIGVHEASNLEFGLGLVKQLQRNIAGGGR
jgi:Family of unknown function (DUF6599)